MKIAIMQPYFFPYIGYWQLISAVDCFVLFDDAQYMRHGWVNRNRILKPNGGWQYVLVPLKKHALTESIKNVCVHPEKQWRELILAQLTHYKKKAPYFLMVNELMHSILFECNEDTIALLNFSIIKKMCEVLAIDTKILLSSECHFDYSRVTDAGEWALNISEQMGAVEYVNPKSGSDLFDAKKFAASHIDLSFLLSKDLIYSQRGNFEPSLSIIDVLMYNGVGGTRAFLENYSIERG